MARRYPKIPLNSEVLELLKNNVLLSHAVTLMPEQYIRKAVTEYMFCYMLRHLGIVTVNEDPENLKTSMLFSSLGESKERDMFLNTCVMMAKGTVAAVEEGEKSKEQKEQERVQEELAKCSFEQIIENVKNCDGQARVTIMYSRETDDSTANENPVDLIYGVSVEKPAELDFTKLRLENITNMRDLDRFSRQVLAYESGASMSLDVTLDMFDPIIAEVVYKLEEWQELALEECRQSSHNNIASPAVDPWMKLFNGL